MFFFFFFKQKTAYEMRISDWSSDVCSSDLLCVDFPVLCVEARWFWRREVRDGTLPFARDRARHRIHAWCVAADGSCRTCAIDDQVAEGNEISGGTDARCGVCRRNVDWPFDAGMTKGLAMKPMRGYRRKDGQGGERKSTRLNSSH